GPADLAITTDATLNTVSGSFAAHDLAGNTFTLPFGSTSILTGASAFIDDQRLAALGGSTFGSTDGTKSGVTVAGFQMFVVSSTMVQATNFLSAGVSWCP